MARRISRPGTFITWGPLEVPGFPSRNVRIYVPHGHTHDATRPALFMFDGQNIFGDEGSFAGGWFAHEAVDRLAPKTTNIPIVVGIDNSPRRMDELSPWKQGPLGGEAEAFTRWLAGTLVPNVQKEFGLVRGALGAVIAGSSLGGLGALYAHFAHPEAFGGALCMSPSFFFGRGQLTRMLETVPIPMFSRVYVDCGAKEGGPRMMKAAEGVVLALQRRGYGGDRLMWRPDSRGTHNERHWRRRLPKALRFMFRK